MFYNAANGRPWGGQVWYAVREAIHAGGENDEGETCLTR